MAKNKTDRLSKKKGMNNLFNIANFVLKKVIDYAPYSSNKNIINNTSEEQAINRLLWVNAMRARNDKEGLRELIYSWNIDVSREKRDEHYQDVQVRISSKQCKITKLANYLKKNVEMEDYLIHLNDKSQIIEVHCTLTDLNNYVYDEINPISFKEKRKNNSSFSDKERLESVTQRLSKWGIGNCSDLSQAALAMLMHYPVDGLKAFGLAKINTKIPIEILAIENGDHEFVAINRNQNSKLNNPQDWGKEVIILDPWYQTCYLLKDGIISSSKNDSKDLIMSCKSFEILDKGVVAEGASKYWQKKYGKKNQIFNLKKREVNIEEKIPWLRPIGPSNNP